MGGSGDPTSVSYTQLSCQTDEERHYCAATYEAAVGLIEEGYDLGLLDDQCCAVYVEELDPSAITFTFQRSNGIVTVDTRPDHLKYEQNSEEIWNNSEYDLYWDEF